MIAKVDRALAPGRLAKGARKSAMFAAEALELSGIPMPPSTNTLTANLPGRGRCRSERYRTWAVAAGWEVRAQARGRRVAGPVRLTYIYGENGTRADLGNLEKAMTDLLVDLCIIDGDDRSIVRSIKLDWGHGDKAGVRIEPAPAQAALFGRAA